MTSIHATVFTSNVINTAKRAGLRPVVAEVTAGMVTIEVNAPGEFGSHGTITVGVCDGRIRRAVITFGNDGPVSHADNATQTAALIRECAQRAAHNRRRLLEV